MGPRDERVCSNEHGFGQSISSSFVRITQTKRKYEILCFLGTFGYEGRPRATLYIQTYDENVQRW